MRTTSMATAFVLLFAGCGFDRDPTAPEDPGLTLPAQGLLAPERDFAAAAVATNLWTTKAPKPSARAYFAAAVVNGVLYTVGGSDARGTKHSTVEAYSPGSNSWTTRKALPAPRGVLNGAGVINGVLYVAGGKDTSNVDTRTLFAYSPSTNTWSTRAPMPVAGGCGASGVLGGRLYVYSGCDIAVSFQRYDPATNSWKSLAVPASPHTFPVAGGIGGKFYLAGGRENGMPSAVMEVYDPATNTWTALPSMLSARYGAVGGVIDGLLYIAGGWGQNGPVATAEVYDPVSATWRVRPSITTARVGMSGGPLNGKLHAIGGVRTDGELSTVDFVNEVYTPGDVWLTKRDMPAARDFFATAVMGGKLYVFGGRDNGSPIATSQVYDPGTNRWASRAPMPQPRALSNGAGVIAGIVYVPGGQGTNGVYTNSLYAYNPATNAWTSKAPMPVASGCGGSGAIGGKLYVYTMCHASGRIQSGLYVYNTGTNSWGVPISLRHFKYPAVGVVNGKLYLVGGVDSTGTVTTNFATAYDPATGQWIAMPPMSVERSGATAVGLNGLLYVIGGMTKNGEKATTVEVYNPATNSWRTVTGMPTGRWGLGSGVIGGKVYAVGGNDGTTLATSQVYIP